jgi:hypothetical protein
MPGAIHNYWLGIMALAFALAIAVWIGLVFMANRHPGGKAQESWPHRDVMGGAFSAAQGGRQVTPDPRVPPESEAELKAESEAEVAAEQQSAEQQAAAQQAAARPPAPRVSTETGVGTGQEPDVRTGRT